MGDADGKTPKVPEWLPDGWIMKVNRRGNGKLDRYYVCPVSGYTFRSRIEVMRYLNVEKVNGLPPVTTACCEEDKPCVTECSEEDKPCVTECSEEDKPCDVERAKNSPTWLPSGWILEIRTCKNGANVGKKYKCYIDPLTGSRFYTKAGVFSYLKTGKRCNSSPRKKKPAKAEPKEKHMCNSTLEQKSINADSEANVQSLIDTSPDGLPPGWIKETRCKRSASGLRKDPYYTDPVSGYVFRSKKDALRYIATGEISRHAFKPKTKRIANEMYFIENESPSPISAQTLKGQGGQGTKVKRRLFAGNIRRSSRNITKESNELLGEQGAGPSCAAPSDDMFLKDKQVKAINLTNLHENELPDKPLEAAEEEALDQVIEKLLDSVSKNSPGSPDGKLSDPVAKNLQNPLNMEWLEVVGGGTLKPADKILSQSSKPVDNPVESTSNIRMEPSNEMAREIGGNKKIALVDQQSPKNIHKNPILDGMRRVDVEPFVLAKATQMESQNGKLLETEEELIRGNLPAPNEMFNLVCGKTSGQGIDELKKEGKKSANGSTQPRKSKARSEKSTPIARRASKRLAGLDAEPAADIEVSDRSLKRGKHITQVKPSSATISLNDSLEVKAEPAVHEEPLGEQVDSEEQGNCDKTAYEGLDCSMASLFGDSWPDPCIEFAFKTLTGEIPVLDTTINSLREQLSPVQNPTSDGPQASVGGCPNGEDQADTQTQLNSAGESNSLPGTDMSPQTSGKGRVKRLCRRSNSRKIPACGK